MKQFYRDLKVGILGGGQLGRMLIQASIDLNINCLVLDPAADAPCSRFAPSFFQGSITDYDSVLEFGKGVDLLTIEIENVNVDALDDLVAMGKQVYPQPHILRMIQNKRLQKQFFQDKGFPTADFVLVENRAEVIAQKDRLPAVNKTGEAGYDGRGVQILRTQEDLPKAFDVPGLLEDLIPFEKELAVLVARNPAGEIETYPPVEMVFHPEHNLVEYLFAPASISPQIAEKAKELAESLVQQLEYVGLMAIEMFLTKEGELLINELAPRPHNSGHHTIRACATSQYEQHLRAILGLPLGSPMQLCPAAMVNMLGEAGQTGAARFQGIDRVLAVPGAYPHIYGKASTKPFRKMGHVTLLGKDLEELTNSIKAVQMALKVVSEG